MGREVDGRHLTGLLGSAGKSIAAMPDGHRFVARLRSVDSRDDLLRVLKHADLGVEKPARQVITDAAAGRRWEEVRATLLMSAEMQLHERFNSNA